MQFQVFSKPFAQLPVDCLVVGIHENGELGDEARQLDRACKGALGKMLAHGDFPGRTGETLLLPGLPGLKATRTLLVGQGVGRRDRARAGGDRGHGSADAI